MSRFLAQPPAPTGPRFGVQHRGTGLFFVGFRDDNSVIWGAKADARPHAYRLDARGQAYLLRRGGHGAQIKTAVLA